MRRTVHHMSITLRPEQEQVLVAAINSGLAHSTDEALDRAIDTIPSSAASTEWRPRFGG